MIPAELYAKLAQKKERGWTEVDSEEEFLAKLHYLRAGMAENKRPKEELLRTEEKLVVKFWEKHL